jgi:hypothetical protein
MSYVSQPYHELALRSPARPLARGCPMGKPIWDARTLCWCETLWTQPNVGTKRDK